MYTPIVFSIVFYLFVSLLVITILLDSYTKKRILNIKGEEKYLYLVPLFLVILIGFRPVGIDGFIDSGMYEALFRKADIRGTSPMIHKDVIFGYLVLFISYFTNERGFFVSCGLISVLLLIFTAKYISKKYWILFFISHAASLYYWNYNVYGIRQGLASSIFLYAIFVKKWWWKLLLMIVALGIHFSIILPILGYICTVFVRRVYKSFYIVWILVIPISYFFGSKIEYIISLFVPDKRAGYLTRHDMDRQGFRLDMIAYSFVLIAISYYFIYIEKIKDKTYQRIVNLFIFTNTIFLFLIRVNHAHRFAYLSWFLASLVVFYPFFISHNGRLKEKYKMFSQTLLVFFTFVLLHFIKITFF